MKNGQKRALVLSYLFPPIGGIGVQRPLKFVKYLRDFDIEPVVLTTGQAYYPTMDESLNEQIPEGVKVHRVNDPISRLIGKMVTKGVAAPGTSQDNDANAPSFRDGVKSFLKKLKNILLVPDERIYWAIRAAVVGVRLISSERIDCIYTTSGPASSHIAGWIIHQWTGVKWVADFRDPWTDNLHFNHRGLRARFERWMEKQVFLQAEAITVVTDGFRDLFAEKYPMHAHKIEVIRNGFDPLDFPDDDMAVRNTKRKSRRFTFFYAGILYEKRSPEPFLQALSSLIRYGHLSPQDVVVQFAGVFDYPGQSTNTDLVETLGLKDVVEVLGYLPHHEVLRKEKCSDALLLIGEKSQHAGEYVPGKLYEYFCARRPIVAMVEEGEAAKLIREVQAGNVVSPYNMKAIADEILRIVKHGTDRAFQPNEDILASFSRKGQTGQLAELMKRLTNFVDVNGNGGLSFDAREAVTDIVS